MLSSQSRRELIATFLGAPLVALAGCGSDATTPPLPPGELAGASSDFGHRIRDLGSSRVSVDRWEKRSIVIVGGGMAGLSAARRLLMAGVRDFVILELEAVAGGTSRSGQSPVCPYPWGAHYVPAPSKETPAIVNLFDEMGLVEGRTPTGEPIFGEQFLWRDPQERVFYGDHWEEGIHLRRDASPEDYRQQGLFQQHVYRWAGWRDRQGRRAFDIPMARSSDDAQVTNLDKISMADWMRQQGLTSPQLHWLVDYACRDDYGLSSERTSAWAGLFYFASRRSTRGERERPYLTFPEGNGRIVNHLAKLARERIETGWGVAEIVPTDTDGKQGVDIVALSADNQIRGYHAEFCLFAAPQFLAPYVIRPWRTSPPAHTSEFQYGAWTVVNLHLAGRPRESEEIPLCWDNVIYDSPSLGYVVATHQAAIDYGPTIFTWYYPMSEDDPKAGRERLLSLGRDEWAEIALADLSQPHPDLRGLVERIDVMRWGHAMTLPRPGFLWGGTRQRAAEPFRNIHFGHSDLSGMALFEEAFYRGTHAAEAILKALGRVDEKSIWS